MDYLIVVIIVSLAIGFGAGILIGRNNKKTVDEMVTKLKEQLVNADKIIEDLKSKIQN